MTISPEHQSAINTLQNLINNSGALNPKFEKGLVYALNVLRRMDTLSTIAMNIMSDLKDIEQDESTETSSNKAS